MSYYIPKQTGIKVKEYKKDTNCGNCNWTTNTLYDGICGNCFIEQIIFKER